MLAINYHTLACEDNPRPLGDQIDHLFLAHMISKVEGSRVNVQSPNSHLMNYLNQNLITFGNVSVNAGDCFNTKIIWYGRKHKKVYLDISKTLNKIPLAENIKERNIDLPEKFITTQWDAAQLYRQVNRWDDKRIEKIENFYKDSGYEIIPIGGNGKYKDLDDIIYIQSKASLHVGADSGMMHVAKFLMPIENIHVYINIRKRENDERFPDSWNVPWMAREIFRRGAKMNYCEKPSIIAREYFKKVDLWD